MKNPTQTFDYCSLIAPSESNAVSKSLFYYDGLSSVRPDASPDLMCLSRSNYRVDEGFPDEVGKVDAMVAVSTFALHAPSVWAEVPQGTATRAQGCHPILERHHPYRPTPDPASGHLLSDPDITLRAAGFDLNVDFYYSTASSYNGPYGHGRSCSLDGYVLDDTADSAQAVVVRGDQTQSFFYVAGSAGGVTTFTNDGLTYSPTTLAFDGTTFTERFLDGSVITYKQHGAVTAPQKSEIDTVRSAAGAIHTFVYGAGSQLGLLQAVQLPGDRRLTLTHGVGPVVSLVSGLTDWSGRIWTLTYDASGCQTSYQIPTGCTTNYQNASFGGATFVYSIQDPLGFSTYYNLNSSGQVITMVAGTAVHTYAYGRAVGGGMTATMPTGAIVTYQMDTNGRVAIESRPEGFVITYGYDANGNRIQKQMPYGNDCAETFDGFGRLLTTTDPSISCGHIHMMRSATPRPWWMRRATSGPKSLMPTGT